ncbi:MAG: hypothetical protein ACLGIO_01870, partial [Acidimicrobiia bacterium]
RDRRPAPPGGRRAASPRRTVAAAVVGMALLAAGCGDGQAGGEQAGPTAAPTSTTTAAGSGRFCAVLAATDGEVEESYLGSPEHLAELDRMVAAAPDDVRPDVEAFRDHVVELVDPAVPGSADMARYPEPVRAAIGRIQAYRDAHC